MFFSWSPSPEKNTTLILEAVLDNYEETFTRFWANPFRLERIDSFFFRLTLTVLVLPSSSVFLTTSTCFTLSRANHKVYIYIYICAANEVMPNGYRAKNTHMKVASFRRLFLGL